MEKQADTKSFINCIHIKDYKKFKYLIHPNITDHIGYYKKGNYYLFPTYHSCGLRNWNSIKKRVDYKRGYQCMLPSSNPYWRTKEKYTQTKVYNTRYQTQYNIHALALVKGHYYYNHKSKEYKHHNWWHERIGF